MPLGKIKNVGITKNGISYNSYLIADEKTVLIDTVPPECANGLTDKLKECLGDKKLDYIILNHTEQDRSGAVAEVLRKYPNAVVISTIAGLKNLDEQLNADFLRMTAKSNHTLKIGERVTLRYIITHNINWPDSMMIYYEEEKALFSCDAFSKEVEQDGLFRYYNEKLSYLSGYIYQAMKILSELDFDVIYPGSGAIENDVPGVIKKYTEWSAPKEKKNKKIAVIYESKTGNTEKAAKTAYEILQKSGTDAVLLNVKNTGKKEVLECIGESDGVMFGSPTEYRNIPQGLSDIIMSLNHYEMAEKKFAAYGSFGWSGEAPNLIYSYLKARHFDTFKSPYRFMFTPSVRDMCDFEKYVTEFNDAILKK